MRGEEQRMLLARARSQPHLLFHSLRPASGDCIFALLRGIGLGQNIELDLLLLRLGRGDAFVVACGDGIVLGVNEKAWRRFAASISALADHPLE